LRKKVEEDRQQIRREIIATAVMNGFAASLKHLADSYGGEVVPADAIARDAIAWADALIAELDKPAK
jgi:hypothetical protein